MDPGVAKERGVDLREEGRKVNRKTASKCKGREGGQRSRATGRAKSGQREVDRATPGGVGTTKRARQETGEF